eukprot:CAMPEP_0175068862 /NCGR_PEP_ID=MMETSP0052_2-20121109/17896_1 /TAXON_ID=51329 ORGANISM="Polytomella parva, Strain SAG 63-3" /NCGR_SAMPLE_ID=MMETSP0052_2 /ASSEMBLY_ACC=CAM_ASM_000194 /LENGTH=191 /DNA_ID=CAMNT_0016335915 /DNA_START=443 /DNA_END=1018 /DNA_ORIENTATION=-
MTAWMRMSHKLMAFVVCIVVDITITIGRAIVMMIVRVVTMIDMLAGVDMLMMMVMMMMMKVTRRVGMKVNIAALEIKMMTWAIILIDASGGGAGVGAGAGAGCGDATIRIAGDAQVMSFSAHVFPSSFSSSFSSSLPSSSQRHKAERVRNRRVAHWHAIIKHRMHVVTIVGIRRYRRGDTSPNYTAVEVDG